MHQWLESPTEPVCWRFEVCFEVFGGQAQDTVTVTVTEQVAFCRMKWIRTRSDKVHSNTLIRTQTHAFTLEHAHSHSNTRIRTLTRAFALEHAHSHSNTRICTRTRAFALEQAHLHSNTRIRTRTSAFALEHMHLACRGCCCLDIDLDCLVYQLVAIPPYIHMHFSILGQHDVHQQFSAPVCACMQLVYAHVPAYACTQDGGS
jgi:hypothetical protein